MIKSAQAAKVLVLTISLSRLKGVVAFNNGSLARSAYFLLTSPSTLVAAC